MERCRGVTPLKPSYSSGVILEPAGQFHADALNVMRCVFLQVLAKRRMIDFPGVARYQQVDIPLIADGYLNAFFAARE